MRAIRSLGLRTDLLFVSWEGTVVDLGDCLEARVPASPDYYFGNFLLYPDAPARGETTRWIARFRERFGDDPRVRHMCLRWDRPDGEAGAIDELQAMSFTVDHGVVLTATRVHPPPRPNRDVEIRAVRTDADWDAVRALQVATAVESFGAGVESWANDMVSQYRRFAERRRGAWFAAWDGATLAGDLGVFVDDDGVARYRSVETSPAYRRRGVCGTLTHHAASAALDSLGAKTLVMVADPDYHAAQVYESVGFAPTERLVAAYKKPRP